MSAKFGVAAVVGGLALLAVASIMASSNGPVALEGQRGLASENAQLRSEVAQLEQKLARRGSSGGSRQAKAVAGLNDRMAWAKKELAHITGGRHGAPLRQQLRVKEIGIQTIPQKTPGEFDPATEHTEAAAAPPPAVHTLEQPKSVMTIPGATGRYASASEYWPGSEPWVKVLHNGEALDALTTPGGDTNPLALLKPGDYWKDPYDKPFLQAPYPHDPSSTLAHTVTGDYASPATWGEIYHDKQTIDWCTSYFPFFNDRIKCISKLHSSGPLLG